MLNVLRLRLAVGLAVLWFGLSPAHAQVAYTVTNLGAPPGATSSAGGSVNEAGQVTGFYLGATPEHAFRWTPATGMADINATAYLSFGFGINASGQIVGHVNYQNGVPERAFRTTSTGDLSNPAADLGTLPGGRSSGGRGINASGQVTGYSSTTTNPSNGMQHAFRTTATGNLSDPGADLGTLPGGSSSRGLAINASGQVTGFSNTAAGFDFRHAFRTTATGNLSDPGADLGTLPGGNWSEGFAINASGQVVGRALAADGSVRAFRTTATGNLADPGADLGTLPGFTDSFAFGINAFGVVVGNASLASAQPRAIVVDATGMHDLNDLIPSNSGWVLRGASSISDTGYITGGGTFNGEARAFLLTPVGIPEPGSFVLVPLAVAGWLVRRRRRRDS